MKQGTWVDHHLPSQLPGHYLTLESQEDLICNYTAKMSENSQSKIFFIFFCMFLYPLCLDMIKNFN